jgi:acyl-CoA hydrolase
MVKGRLALGKVYQKEQESVTVASLEGLTEKTANDEEYQELIDMEDTELRVRKIFMPRHLNALGTIFGGDLLEWMEGAAVSCARHHLRNPSAVTVAMDRLFFHRPVRPNELADLTARVVRVGRDAVEIETEVRILRPFLAGDGPGAPPVFSHTGIFRVLNAAENGYRRPVLAGLRAATPAARLRAARALHRAAFGAAHAGEHAWAARRAHLDQRPYLPEASVGTHFFGHGI